MSRVRSDLTAVAAILLGAAGCAGATVALTRVLDGGGRAAGVACAAETSVRGLTVTGEGKGRVVVVPRVSKAGPGACRGRTVSHAITLTPAAGSPYGARNLRVRLGRDGAVSIQGETVRLEGRAALPAERSRLEADRARLEAQQVQVRLRALRQALDATKGRIEALNGQGRADEARLRSYRQAMGRYQARIEALQAALAEGTGGGR